MLEILRSRAEIHETRLLAPRGRLVASCDDGPEKHLRERDSAFAWLVLRKPRDAACG